MVRKRTSFVSDIIRSQTKKSIQRLVLFYVLNDDVSSNQQISKVQILVVGLVSWEVLRRSKACLCFVEKINDMFSFELMPEPLICLHGQPKSCETRRQIL